MTGMENCEEAEPKPSAPEPQPSEEDIAKASSSSMIPANSWFTPKRLLVVFCLINLLNYLDRGAIASNGVNGTQRTCTKSGTCKGGSGIQGHFNLNNFEDGMLSSAFMVGLLVASPIFAALAKSVNPFRLIGVGMTVWTLSTAGCGFAFSFWFIALCRVLVGVGEASFISLAAPFIDDNAPAPQKTAWLAIFYMCIPTGYALGYVYGGLVGTKFGWRVAFWVESVVMIPFVIMGFVMKPLQLKGFVPAESIKAVAPETVVSKVQDVEASNGKDKLLSSKVEFRDESSHQPSKWSKSASKAWDQTSKFMKDMKVLLLEKVFVINVLGAAFVKSLGLFGTFMLEVAGELMDFVPQSRYIAYNFVIGAYSYWGPKAGYSIYNMTNADMIFGGITIICGIFGTLGGGLILDYMTSTISNAFKFLSFTTFLGAAFCFGAFLFRSMYGFLALFSIGELFVFATQGPVNYICLHCVTPSLRPLSMAMSTVAIHVFGDVPSSPLVGILQDHAHNWRTTTLSLTSILFLAAGLWFIGVFMHPVDRFNEESEHESSNSSPLLQENTGEAATSPASAQH